MDDVIKKVTISWLKLRSASGILFDHQTPSRLKRKFHRTVIRPIML